MRRHSFRPQFILGLCGLVLAVVGFAAAAYSDRPATDQPAAVSVFHDKTPPKITPQEAAQATATAKQVSTAFRVASERVLPSLVWIETRINPKPSMNSTGNGMQSPMGQNPFKGTPFEDMFRNFQGNPGFQFEQPDAMPQQGLGSGVIIDASGLIMTNNHVVAGGKDVAVTVRLQDGREYAASKVWTDPKTDIAIVKIDHATDLVPAKLGDSDAVAVGEWVIALGQPYGLESSVTAGIISATHRGVGIAERENFLQTDAAINPGNSGGPLINLDGEVIGINTAIKSQSGSNAGIGFAVPINLAKWVGDQLSATGTVRRAYLGVGIQMISADIAGQLGVKPKAGVAVTLVQPGTPADKAGLKVGDVIANFAGQHITTPQELQIAVERANIGSTYAVDIFRNGKAMSLTFVAQEQPAGYGSVASSEPQQPEMNSDNDVHPFGFVVGDLTPDVATRLGMPGASGVVVTGVDPNGSAARAGLSVGDVIRSVNRQDVQTADQCREILGNVNAKDGVLMLVQNQMGTRFLVLEAR